VTITPKIETEGITSFCIGELMINKPCDGELKPYCSFTVGRNICINIPLVFSATADPIESKIVCGEIEKGPCPGDIIGCTYSFGHFKNHPDLTNSLIESTPNGQIILGTASGVRFTVVATTANAQDILDFNPPPPAPDAVLYPQLYAQLLAANLNVLRLQSLGIEVCPEALAAITAANNFLASSDTPLPPNQVSAVMEPLEDFNKGEIPGCPPHCPDDEGEEEE